ncbi:MAG: YgiT-type zinc finger protein [Chloroflexi bacterium]|nr:YgiT-type zinc finger protein [Chloroflexota bacterium]
MYRCQVCGATEARSEVVSEVFLVDRLPVLVEDIPAVVCARCGDATFSRVTTERIRRMVHGEMRPVRTMRADVFAYA